MSDRQDENGSGTLRVAVEKAASTASSRRRAARRKSGGPAPIAVIDIGSNSGRVTVMRLLGSGHLEVVADARTPLRLWREIKNGRLSRAAIERTISALYDFRAVALGAGAGRFMTVATSAVRESSNADELVGRVRRELGMKVVVIDGEMEAAYAFLGAVHGLPVDHGLLLDLGGGSLEVTHFRDRRLVRSWTLPLGALRLSDRFLSSDPPRAAELARLKAHVEKTLRKSGVPRLASDERLIGTGGTIRNIAKVVARTRRDPLSRVHGSILSLWRVRDLAGRASRLRLSARAAIPGVNKDRADTIVGGFLTVQTAMQLLGGDEILVSAQGLREGLALATLDAVPPLAPAVRRASVAALVERFSTWRPEAAQRRARIAEKLLGILVPQPQPPMRELLGHVCTLLDIGQSVDYYDRYRNTASIVAASDLRGFSARGIALLCSVLQQAAQSNGRTKRPRRPLRPKDGPLILCTAAILSLADEIERRCLPGQPLHVRFRITPEELVLHSEALAGWKVRAVGDRFHHAFGRDLRIEGR